MGTTSPAMSDLWISMRPYPGRLNHVLRAMVACTIVVIMSQSLQVPLLALSLITVFFVTQTNIVVTRLTGILFIVGSTFSILLSLMVLKVTWNTPFLRILISFTLFFVSVFLMRTTKIGVVFFVVAIVAIYTQSLVDISPDAETLVRGILWVWVAVNYPIAVTLIVNSLLMPVEPEIQLKRAIGKQLSDMASLLSADATLLRRQNTLSQAGRDIQTLYRLLRYKTMRDKHAAQKGGHYLTAIAIVSELRTASCHLPASFEGEDVLKDAETLRNALKPLELMLINGEPDWQTKPPVLHSAEPAFIAIAGIISSYNKKVAAAENKANTQVPSPATHAGFLVKDAFSNEHYVFFSLKTLLSAAVCYLFYTATDWSGIHTIMLSCLIVAQPGLGNTQRKIILRLVGAAVGSVFALVTIVYLTPRIDTLFGLLCIVLPVIALSSWISAGPENVSYAGVQIMFTFALATLETFGPVTGLTEVRDRIVGIILGIIVAGLIHTLIRPEREGGVMLQNLGALFDEARSWLHSATRHNETRQKVATGLVECEDIAARVAIEPTWFSAEGSHDQLHQHSLSILNAIKNVLFYIDRVSFEKEHLKNQEPANEFILGIQGNMDKISSVLNGRTVGDGDVYYPVPDSVLPDSFMDAAKGLEESQRHFFNLTSTL
ncbi:FUSC family protein [Enterobacter sp. LM3]